MIGDARCGRSVRALTDMVVIGVISSVKIQRIADNCTRVPKLRARPHTPRRRVYQLPRSMCCREPPQLIRKPSCCVNPCVRLLTFASSVQKPLQMLSKEGQG